jgi:catechol 2,3-dioxygenase-like lactoylglutathione lyase family enzyme
MRIRLAGIPVEDQDVARKVYTEKLGFRVKTDAQYGPGMRWLTVVSSEDPDGVELLLGLADEAERAGQAARRAAGKPATSFTTDDVRRDAQLLESRGVTFRMEPTPMPYGGTDAVFDDGCGNLVAIHQD